jgi:hypothetical protein
LYSVLYLLHIRIFVKIMGRFGDVSFFALGLTVLYSDGADDYLDFVQSTGLRIVVHSQQDTIFPDSQGFSVASGYKTTAAIDKVPFFNMHIQYTFDSWTFKNL